MQFFRYHIVLEVWVYKFSERCDNTGQELEQKLLHEVGLQLKHVVIKSAVAISMSIDLEKRRSFGSRKFPLCVS